jgi:predicted metal-binding protein
VKRFVDIETASESAGSVNKPPERLKGGRRQDCPPHCRSRNDWSRIEVRQAALVLDASRDASVVNLAKAFERIKQTSFHYQQEIMDQLLTDASRGR